MKLLIKLIVISIVFCIVLNQAQADVKYKYVKNEGLGTQDGDSEENCMAFLATALWSSVQTTLAEHPVTVYFLDDNYTHRISSTVGLRLADKGNATNQLVLQGYTDHAVLMAETGYMIDINNCQNIKIQNLNFETNSISTYALLIRKGSHNIEVNECNFIDVNGVEYGAIGIADDDTCNITICNNTFQRVGLNRLAHMIYAAWGPHNLDIHNNIFEDCGGVYLKFRDRVNDVNVSDNTFTSTGTYSQEDPNHRRGLIFIDIENENKDESYNEMFGNGYDIHGNNFNFATPLDTNCRDAVKWYHDGHETGGFDQIPNSNDANALKTGGPNYKRDILADAGIKVGNFNIYSNTYNSNVKRRAVYEWNDGGGNYDEADVYNALYQARFNYDYENEGDTGNPTGWTCQEYPPDTDVNITMSPTAGHGTHSVCLLDSSSGPSGKNCYMRQSVGTGIPRGYYRTCVYVTSHNSDLYPIYTNSSPTIYWIRANNNGTWSSNDGNVPFDSLGWTTGHWYLLEIEFNFDTDRYSVWIDNSIVAEGVEIPGTDTSMSGNLTISPATNSTTGTMLIDFNKLGTYE
jgi:hypothetical protein